MEKRPLISVIVPIYKTEKYINECIDSILNQTYKNLEVLLIDDGSPDSCPQICDNYAKLDERVKVIHKENAGLSDTRNVGLKNLTGDYFLVVDSDDYIEPDTVEYSLKIAQKYNADVVMWDYIREFKDASLKKTIFNDDEVIFDGEGIKNLRRRFFGLYKDELREPDKLESLSVFWGKLYKSSVKSFFNTKFEDTKKVASSEDALWNGQVFGDVKKAVYIKKYFNHYRKYNENSITMQYRANLPEKWEILYRLFEDTIEKDNLTDDFKEALNNRICVNIISLGLNILSDESSNFRQRRAELKRILNLDRFKNAYKKFSLKYLKIHYKIFFFFAKYRLVTLLYLNLKAMEKLMNYERKKK
jgi:glycosyltransferase EpsH